MTEMAIPQPVPGGSVPFEPNGQRKQLLPEGQEQTYCARQSVTFSTKQRLFMGPLFCRAGICTLSFDSRKTTM